MARMTNKKTAINSPKKRGGEFPGRKRNRLFHLSDNARWVVGLVLFFFAVYLLWICVSYFFTWDTDSLPVGWSGGQDEPSAADAVPTGEKGSLGVMMARAVVGRGFGFFAVGLPLI
ncbi:MAG: hypothetical protein LBU97_05215, partial [Alistipes sp.]|nr:hypothetical protein [Alistipes sp.]